MIDKEAKVATDQEASQIGQGTIAWREATYLEIQTDKTGTQTPETKNLKEDHQRKDITIINHQDNGTHMKTEGTHGKNHRMLE